MANSSLSEHCGAGPGRRKQGGDLLPEVIDEDVHAGAEVFEAG